MNIKEYKSILSLEYRQYCDYLQDKYGIGLSDYMRKSWTKNPKCARTKEGLFSHHKYEDCAALLSNVYHAKQHPFEWQEAHNIVYCDYLEHLYLHILIFEYSLRNKEAGANGIGGIFKFLVPELNDIYSGWTSTQQWKIACQNRILRDKDVYMLLLKRLINNFPGAQFQLCTSLNAKYGGWSENNNKKLYKKIMLL